MYIYYTQWAMKKITYMYMYSHVCMYACTSCIIVPQGHFTIHHITSRQCMQELLSYMYVLWYMHHWTGVARAMRVSWTAAVAKIKISWVGLQKYCSFSFRVLFLFHQVSHTMHTTTAGYGFGGREGLTDTTHAHASSNAQLSPPKWWQWK